MTAIKKFHNKHAKISKNKSNEYTPFKSDNKMSNISQTNFVLSLANKNNWIKVLPYSCKVNPLYFSPLYPWNYRMSSNISNYQFGKKPINNLLSFNLNLSIKFKLTGANFFSNYDTTNYGKLNNKRLPLYRVYPSLSSSSLAQPLNYIYTPASTNINLPFLPYNKYCLDNKISGNPWFIDHITNTFLRRDHHIYPYNIMSRETDSIISMFDNKISELFHPLSTTYNLQRVFTLGLSSASKIFMPYRYLRSSQIFSTRAVFWSQKYHNFWNQLQQYDVLTGTTILRLFDLYIKQLFNNMYSITYIGKFNNLIKYDQNFNENNIVYLSILSNKNINILSPKNLLFDLKYQTNLLSNNVLKPFANHKLSIDIEKGRSLLGNFSFSTKKLAVVTSRALYHYYPFHNKKPYGTGLKQVFKIKSTKSIKFNKIKVSNLNQIMLLANISHYTCNFFNKLQQLSRWSYTNKYTYNLFNNKSSLLNCLTLINSQFYSSKLIYNRLGSVSYKTTYQHLMPQASRLKSFFNTFNLYNYLTHSQYHLQLYKKQSKKKWHRNHKSFTFNNKILYIKFIYNWFIQSLNNRVKQFVYNQYAHKCKVLSHQFKLLKKTYGSDSNWLKYYINIPQRFKLYKNWVENYKSGIIINRKLKLFIKRLNKLYKNLVEDYKSGIIINRKLKLFIKRLNKLLSGGRKLLIKYVNKTDVYKPGTIINKKLLVKALNKWLNTHFDFYKVYNQVFSKLHSPDIVNVGGLILHADADTGLIDKTIIYKSRIYKFINRKIYKQQFAYLSYLYYRALIVKPNYDINKNWELPWVVKSWRLTLPQWNNILKKKKALWFSGYNNHLDVLQQLEKNIYLNYNQELDLYMKTHRLEQQRLQQERLEQQRLEQQRLEQERLEQQRLEQERLQRIKLEQQQRKLQQEKRKLDKELVHVPLGQRMPNHIWKILEQWQQTEYFVHQKRLAKEAKRLGLPIPPTYKNKNKNKNKN